MKHLKSPLVAAGYIVFTWARRVLWQCRARPSSQRSLSNRPSLTTDNESVEVPIVSFRVAVVRCWIHPSCRNTLEKNLPTGPGAMRTISDASSVGPRQSSRV